MTAARASWGATDPRWRRRSPYEILGVPPSASPREIKQAWRRRAFELHPDRNPSATAHADMAELNAAYRILSDPVERQKLDQFLRAPSIFGEAHGDDAGEPGEAGLAAMREALRCQRCGELDPTTRLYVFPYVFSMLLAYVRGGVGGLHCARCRRAAATRALAVTALLGWWSFVGFFYSIEAVFRALFLRPILPDDENAEYLAMLGWALLRSGRPDDARVAWTASLRHREDPRLREMLDRHGGPLVRPGTTAADVPAFGLRLALVGTPLFLLVLCFGGPSSEPPPRPVVRPPMPPSAQAGSDRWEEFDGSGGYRYRRSPDGDLEIIRSPVDPLVDRYHPVPVARGTKAWEAIQREYLIATALHGGTVGGGRPAATSQATLASVGGEVIVYSALDPEAVRLASELRDLEARIIATLDRLREGRSALEASSRRIEALGREIDRTEAELANGLASPADVLSLQRKVERYNAMVARHNARVRELEADRARAERLAEEYESKWAQLEGHAIERR